MEEINYITIYDSTAEAKFVFVSESVTEVLGYKPEELIGQGGYSLIHPLELKAINLIHSINVKNQKMSSITAYRTKHKDGHYITIDSVVHYCYDSLVCTNFVVDSSDSVKHKMRFHSADERFIVQKDGSIQLSGAWNDSQIRMKNLLQGKDPWTNKSHKERIQLEPRFCLFINRYTTQSTIVFATRMCEELVGLSQLDCIGQSLYEYVARQDRESVKMQIEIAKANDIIARIRFNWMRGENDLVPLEAVVSCTYDGLVFVARISPILLSM